MRSSTRLIGKDSSALLRNARWILGRTPQPFLGTRAKSSTLLVPHPEVPARHWPGTPSQYRQDNRLYRQMRIGAAHRELPHSQVEYFVTPGYTLVPRTLWLRRFSSSALLTGAFLWHKARDDPWWLGKIPIKPRPRLFRLTPASFGSSITWA